MSGTRHVISRKLSTDPHGSGMFVFDVVRHHSGAGKDPNMVIQ